MPNYAEIHARSRKDPEGFWAEIAQGIDWTKKWDRVLDDSRPVQRWFAGGGEMQTALIFTAILLHGACYDFLFIAGQLYVDEEANERIRGAAQGLIAFILWGVGAFVGTLLAGQVLARHALPAPVNGLSHDWKAIWLTPAWGALAVLVIFVIFFRNPSGGKSAAR